MFTVHFDAGPLKSENDDAVWRRGSTRVWLGVIAHMGVSVFCVSVCLNEDRRERETEWESVQRDITREQQQHISYCGWTIIKHQPDILTASMVSPERIPRDWQRASAYVSDLGGLLCTPEWMIPIYWKKGEGRGGPGRERGEKRL